MKRFLFALITVFLLPKLVFSSLIITEIMYDLEGADTSREWIEVKNNSSQEVNLTDFKFFENNINHGISAIDNENISANGYAVIVSSVEKFKADNSSFSGNIFKSSFSLNNTGETLSLKNESGDTVDSVTYSSETGAQGDGKTLSLINDSWIASVKSPGEVNQNSEMTTVEEDNLVVEAEEVQSSDSFGFMFPKKDVDKIIIETNQVDNSMVNVAVKFQASAIDSNNGNLSHESFFWNFGDGHTLKGRQVSHAYKYPGRYLVVLEVESSGFSQFEQMEIDIYENTIKIVDFYSGYSGYTELLNESEQVVDISSWLISADKSFKSIPENTFILPRQRIILDNSIIDLVGDSEKVSLHFPNYAIASILERDSNIESVVKESCNVLMNFEIELPSICTKSG
jgi:hypothetical protein